MIARAFKVILPLAVLVVSLAGAYGLWRTKAEIGREPAVEREWTVAAIPAVRVDFRPEIRVYGEIVAGREVELRPLVAGRVIRVGDNFVEGGVVRAGELLVEIDPFDYRADIEEYEARIAEAQADLAVTGAELGAARELLDRDAEQVELARRDVKRREALENSAAFSEKALDEARLVLSQRRQQVITREESIKRFTAIIEQQQAVVRRWQVSLERARRDLEETVLLAPFEGFIVDTDVAVGKPLAIGDRIARLIDAERLEARFHLSDGQYARLLAADDFVGRAARVVWHLGDGRFSYDASIARVVSEIDASSGGVKLFAEIEGAGIDRPLRPGAFVEVVISDRLYEDVVRLPERALHGGDMVYTVVDGRLASRRVELVLRSGSDVLVTGDLAPEELVVTTRFAEMSPGVRVSVTGSR